MRTRQGDAMSQRARAQILVDRWDLGRLFRVHAASVHNWTHEGLAEAALLEPGGPGRAALFDAERAIEWFRRTKLRVGEIAPTLGDIKALVAQKPARADHGLHHPARRAS
jgi:phage terminase Nu1 subunit (DNA packaging protein)